MKTDAEILKEGTDVLLDKLGPDGTMQFIAEIKRGGLKKALSALADAAEAFTGGAKKAGLETEEEMKAYIKDLRRRIDAM